MRHSPHTLCIATKAPTSQPASACETTNQPTKYTGIDPPSTGGVVWGFKTNKQTNRIQPKQRPKHTTPHHTTPSLAQTDTDRIGARRAQSSRLTAVMIDEILGCQSAMGGGRAGGAVVVPSPQTTNGKKSPCHHRLTNSLTRLTHSLTHSLSASPPPLCVTVSGRE